MCFVCWVFPAAAEPRGQLPALWERLVEVLPSAIALLDAVRPVSPAPLPSRRVLAHCHERIARVSRACIRGLPVRRLGCAGVFARSFRALAEARAPRAPFAEAAEEASRVSLLLRQVARLGCSPDAASDEVPAVVALADGGGALRVEPARPLAAGTTYHLVLEGVPAEFPVPDLSDDGLVRGTVPSALRAVTAGTSHPFLAQLYAAAAHVPGLTVRPTLLVRLSHPLALRSLRRARIGFRLTTKDPAFVPSIPLRTTAGQLLRDARRARAAGRKTARAGSVRVLQAGSPDITALGIAPEALPHVGSYVTGRFVSRDAQSGRANRVPFVVALPRSGAQATVLLLHGLGGTGAAFLFRRADALASRGLAVAAFDMPWHGVRAGPRPFLDTLDPAGFATNIRQATIDAVALATALRTALPAALTPGMPLRLLGYSLGGMVGTRVLAADADIEAAVLVAPAGDLFDFQGLRVAQSLGVPLLACAGGSRDGDACSSHEVCPGGVCAPNSDLYPFAQIATPYRTVVADADPQTVARGAAGPDGARPILIQEAGDDWIIYNSNTAWLAVAVGADMTCSLRADAPQTLCHFRGMGHDLVNLAAPQAQAHEFLASRGRTLVDGGDARAAR